MDKEAAKKVNDPFPMGRKVARKRGCYGQIGLYDRPVWLDFDTICYKELVVTGTNASVPEAWLRARELLRLGLVRSEAMVSGIRLLQDWQDAFAKVQEKGAWQVLMAHAGCPLPRRDAACLRPGVGQTRPGR
ncbi:MAG TPA: hypothetical protein VL485_05195, partial [Ktedonobacteraceae bacterium]|nr:hypothetical protein [Ktedonobacteraceae bacterium]